MKITVEISELDYKALVEQFLPVVREKMAGKDGIGAKTLSILAGMPPSIAGNMIDMMPQDKKDELAVMLIEKNKDKIAEKIVKLAGEKGISFKIDDIDAEV